MMMLISMQLSSCIDDENMQSFGFQEEADENDTFNTMMMTIFC